MNEIASAYLVKCAISQFCVGCPLLFSEVFEKNIVPANKLDAIAAIHAEMADIRSKAIANGTYMKAPNGEKSNLNEAHGYM